MTIQRPVLSQFANITKRSLIAMGAIVVGGTLFMGFGSNANAQNALLPYPPSTKMINERGTHLFVVTCAPLTVCTIFLASGETPNQTRPINVGDSTRWKYDVNTAGGRWFIAIKPTTDNLSQTMQINTDRAAHVIRVVSHNTVDTVTYAFPDPVTAPSATPTPEPTRMPMVESKYSINGNASFRPFLIETDGQRTYLTLGANAYQPTVYGIDSSNQQYPIHVVPPRYQGDNILVLDGVANHIIMETGPGKNDERIEIRRTK